MQQWTQEKIAEHLGISRVTVNKDLKAIHKQWRESAMIDVNEARQRELARIDKMEDEAWKSWHLSCEEQQTNTVKKRQAAVKKDDDKAVIPLVQEATLQKRTQTGDPRYMQIIEWCVEQRRKIIGIDAPEQIHVTAQVKGYSSAFNPDEWPDK